MNKPILSEKIHSIVWEVIKDLKFLWIPALVAAAGFALGSVLSSTWPCLIGICVALPLGIYLYGTPPTV